MSVIIDCRPGDSIICISEFHAAPHGELFSWETSRTFRVGERVRYVGFRKDECHRDHPGLGWLVSFEATDGTQYESVETYFVTEECWEGLARYFTKRSPQGAA